MSEGMREREKKGEVYIVLTKHVSICNEIGLFNSSGSWFKIQTKVQI